MGNVEIDRQMLGKCEEMRKAYHQIRIVYISVKSHSSVDEKSYVESIHHKLLTAKYNDLPI